MLVADASVLYEAVAGASPDTALVERLAGADSVHVPSVADVEFLHALRRDVRRQAVDERRALGALADYFALPLRRHHHDGLAGRIWELRHTVTAYDAAYVALAESLGCPLVTCDGNLARALGHDATIEMFPPA